MGTETKFNCYSENSSTGGGIPKAINGHSSATNTGVNGSAQRFYTNGVNGVNGTDKQNGTRITVAAVVPTSESSATAPVFVPNRIDENDVIEGAKGILKVIRPHWDIDNVQFKKFTDGITNKLVGCFHSQTDIANDSTTTNGHVSPNGNAIANGSSTNGRACRDEYNDDNTDDDDHDSGNLSDSDTNSENAEPTSNVVLVRVYGNKTDLLIDRKAEMRNILLLHTYGFAPSLYATFKNGLAYDYVPGVTLNTKTVLEPNVWRLVARRMAEMHRVVKLSGDNIDQSAPVPLLWKKTQKFLDIVPERFSNADKHKRIEGTFLPISRLRAEFATLYERLVQLGSPVVFSHNDLLLGNIVYMESQNSVTFIDYEYADYNFQAFDIGNHFCEFAGVDEVDFSRYPSREFQLQWLRVYLQTYQQRSQISDAEVERLYMQVNQFALASHFFWIIWSLIQAEHSTIDFDYVEYAFLRYNEYLARKDEFLALGADGSSSSS